MFLVRIRPDCCTHTTSTQTQGLAAAAAAATTTMITTTTSTRINTHYSQKHSHALLLFKLPSISTQRHYLIGHHSPYSWQGNRKRRATAAAAAARKSTQKHVLDSVHISLSMLGRYS